MKQKLIRLLLLLGVGMLLAGCETTYQPNQNFNLDFPPGDATP